MWRPSVRSIPSISCKPFAAAATEPAQALAEYAGLRRFIRYFEVSKMEKQRITVRVAGKEFALMSSDSPEHMARVAAYVDRQITETVFATRQPKETVAVLVAMNVTDELMKAQAENSRLRRELNALRGQQENAR